MGESTVAPPWGFPWGIAMLLNMRSTAMKMLSKRQVSERVLYSPQHIARLEAAGEFPKRVKLGGNRVGWVETEITEWLQRRVDARDQHSASHV